MKKWNKLKLRSGMRESLPGPGRQQWSIGGMMACALVLSFCLSAVDVMSVEGPPTGLHITEFLADNVTVFPDNADFDDYSDWLELHNPTEAAISLNGWFLTDDPAQPRKWEFPEDASIGAGEYLVIRADGFNAVPGMTARREYSPWDSFEVTRFHTSFRLSAGGEVLGLFRESVPPENIDLISSAHVWKFLDSGVYPGASWVDAVFDDTAWNSGQGPLGYGNGGEATVVGYGPSSRDKYITTWFRSTVEVTDHAGLTHWLLDMEVDDGAVVYINGTEAARVRLPEGEIDSQTEASTATEGLRDVIHIDASLFQEGLNIIAIEVHQTDPGSSDLRLDVNLSARRHSGVVEAVDVVEFGQQYPDISWGRDPLETSRWGFFGEPTPGRRNSTERLDVLEDGAAVSMSPDGGSHAGAVEVGISAGSGDAVIRYTMDGSVPWSDAAVYDAPIVLSETTVIRARAFEAGKLPGPVLTRTFLINEPSRTIPLVSLSVDEELYFDDEIGIYSNVHKGREAPVHLEFFEDGAERSFAVNAGTRIAGENIWRFDQKPLTVYMRGKYGDDTVPWPLFPDKRVGSFGEFVLRNGGDNWPNAMLRDAMTPSILAGQSGNEVQSYRPSAVLLNGQYWGIYNIRERLDPVYFFQRFGLNEGTYDYLEFGHIEGNVVALIVDEGDATAWNSLMEFVESHDLSDQENYRHVESLVDVDSFVDYVAIEDFVYNSSWRHNREFWRERRTGARWRWVVPDLDRGFNLRNIQSSLLDNLMVDYPLFDAMTGNEEFRRRLVQRYAAHLASTFHPQRIADIIDRLAAEVDGEIDRHIERWRASGGIQSRQARAGEIQEIKDFAAVRAAEVFRGMRSHLNVDSTIQLRIGIDTSEGGQVLVEGVPLLPEYSSQLEMAAGLDIHLEAVAAPGYEFAGWTTDSGESADPQLVINTDSDQTLHCSFRRTSALIVGGSIEGDVHLDRTDTVYEITSDVVIPPGSSLFIGAGVDIRMAPQVSIVVDGQLEITGTASEPVSLQGSVEGEQWGAIVVRGPDGVANLSHFILRDGGLGPDPVRQRGAISNIGGTLKIHGADINSATTVFALGGDTVMTHSRIHSPITGDGINVKYGTGRVEDCTFFGNFAPDTDAIDFDGVTGGLIARNRIYWFRGPNSDGIDVGEECVDLLLLDNRIYHCSDKGVSVGQSSSVHVLGNLVVDCNLGVAVKDYGSLATVDRNTFFRCNTGVALYEKNLRHGGGQALVTGNIFSRSGFVPVTADDKSEVEVRFSLSDTSPVAGEGSILADPLFVDTEIYNFQLSNGSPAIDSGDPDVPADPDGSRADMGASYIYDPEDYPYTAPGQLVINEILAHSENGEPDWIELVNEGSREVDLSGWFLSDDISDPQKYRIAEGTLIGPGGYLVFSEDLNFGDSSADPGRLIGFALSENGDEVILSSPEPESRGGYRTAESFGASAAGVSKGRIFKASTGTWNFAALSRPTPGSVNSPPLVGPIVISEIMYHPADPSTPEYLELANISSEAVTLMDPVDQAGWAMTGGIQFSFPVADPVVMAPGARLLLVGNATGFREIWQVPDDVPVFQWTGGALSNAGERLELSRPGDLDSSMVQHFIRIDRVNYDDGFPWPSGADGGGSSLTRIRDDFYGNDPSAWMAAGPTPGRPTEPSMDASWLAFIHRYAMPTTRSGRGMDPDGDRISNLVEFLSGTNPLVANNTPVIQVTADPAGNISLIYHQSEESMVNGWTLELQKSDRIPAESWLPVATLEQIDNVSGILVFRAIDSLPDGSDSVFYRLHTNEF